VAQAFQARGDNENALRFGWAAVAAAPRLGLGWNTLADALFSATRYEDGIGAYMEGLNLGWRTSAAYRNLAVAFAHSKKLRAAHEAIEIAKNLDPESVQIRQDAQWINAAYYDPVVKHPGRLPP